MHDIGHLSSQTIIINVFTFLSPTVWNFAHKKTLNHDHLHEWFAGVRFKVVYQFNFGFRKPSRGFHCDSTAFKLNNSINHGKITVLIMSIYCL